MYGQNNFFCMIDGDIIYQVDTYNKTPIGITNRAAKEKDDVLDEYYNKLVELGVIVPPKTQEQINSELQAALIESQNLNRELLQMMQQLKGVQDERAGKEPDQADVPASKSRRGAGASQSDSTGKDNQ